MAQELSYAAYLSFSETGNIGQTFLSHLHGALKQEGIYTFKDDRNQDRGISVSKDSSRAIEESQIIVVVFCENFVLSKDCLDEVVKIMDCRKLLKKIVIPIFYDVEPSEVRRQRNSLAEAFADDSENDDEIGRSERVKRWRDALDEAGNISGFDLRKTHDGNEAECIEQIVKEIVSKLRSEEVAGERQKDEEFGSKFLSERVIGFTRSAASPFLLCVPVFFFFCDHL
uniref:TMV resistance protein N-like n=1 Tax=Nicotiana tabacum TaxID=4097 RepID=A0A1S3ZE47_TOBAC|nr:PREDICTED: TMV resistance protein N-like [Nicotiana tabacum]